MSRVVAFVFARGGSRGIPRKNLRLLAGKSLLARAIEVGKQCPSLSRVVVSTEDEEIAQAAREAGAEVPFRRPAELARDDSPEWLCWQHALRTLAEQDGPSAVDVFVCLPVTAPLRAVEDVEAAIAFHRTSGLDMVFTVTPADKNPYFHQVRRDPDGRVHPVLVGNFSRRQDAPPVYDITPMAYVARPSYVLGGDQFWSGRLGGVVVPRERAVDIDTEMDLLWAEFLLTRQQDQGPIA